MAAVVDTVELIESAAQRCEFVGWTEVPLADKTGGVAQLLEALREHGFGRRDAVVAFFDRWVALDPETHLVPSGHHPCARRVTHRTCRVAISESCTVLGYGVDVRGRNLSAPLKAKFAIAEIIRDDKHDVRFLGTNREHGGREARHQSEQLNHGLGIRIQRDNSSICRSGYGCF